MIKGYNVLLGLPIWNDEVDYWRELFSFSNCGFAFGKHGFSLGYTAEIGPFGCHGISPIIAWGWYALLFGWNGNSIVIANIILLEISYLLFVILAKLNRKSLFVLFFL